METKVSEIAPGVYRLSTFLPVVAPPAGFTFNQFLIDGDEPMLFHCGHRGFFPLISGAVASVMPLERLRWISGRWPQWNSIGSSPSIRNWLKVNPAGGATTGRKVESRYTPVVAPPAGFTFNQFLIDGDEPMLFHCGHRGFFPLISGAVASVMPLERLRWISFGHVEADESGAMNLWLQACPNATVAHGRLGCEVSIMDLADRAPRALDQGEVIDLGGKRMRWIATPHVPHGWEAGVFYEETAGTLFCGDLFTHVGDGPALTEGDIVTPGVEAERMFQAMSLHPATGDIVRGLADLQPRTLALMHGSSFAGDGGAALRALTDFCDTARGN